MEVNIERCHPDAEIPEYQKPGDAGMDLKAVEKIKDTESRLWFKTGLKMAIPQGYVGYMYPRSSISEKSLELANSVGIIDAGFRGNIQVRFNKFPSEEGKLDDGLGLDRYVKRYSYVPDADDYPDEEAEGPFYNEGDRVAQIIIAPRPKIQFNEVSDLSDTERGEGGLGHTGV